MNITFVSGIIIMAIISFVIHKLISRSLQKERKLAEELIKNDNGIELIKKRIKRNSKCTIIYVICFISFLILVSGLIITLMLLIKKNVSPGFFNT